ncbi:CPBP family intramembrane glutamic endopeptidase [Brevibacterium jeotgali]|uniref:Membrane protease YdiL, CAAX protease family n=1 Tax=Brevibacterium jeotgali TaxID=1262550 RepID=A0A2H1L5B4_9MICO|nr:CPBP family intramembrane glutamic endopeptidase [Brevibacterium jeotgali]TWC01826.1 membrane protease YdiL (CAAX protease family) [Brevibacterium jeotgali]SMY11573.1 Membrane protease YdiL, CAAX protease family [Brevibacterium jeotgali]
MTDNVPPPPDQNEPLPDPGPQPGPYVYSPPTGEQPGGPQQVAHPGAAPGYPGAPPGGPSSGPAAHGMPPSGAYPAGASPAGTYPAGAHPAAAFGAPLDTRDPHTPHPGLPFGSSYRTPRSRWWKGAISIVVVIAVMLLFSLLFSIVAVMADMVLGMQSLDALSEGRISMTPAVLAATNLSLIAGAGAALIAHRWINGVRIGYFHSVAPGLRWRWLLISFAIAAPVYLLFAASSFLDPTYQSLTFSGTTLAFLCIIILTTPLQAAAEEYMFRGVVQRSVGGWFRSNRWGFIVGTAVSATAFSAAHFAADVWLIVYYLLFGVLLSVLTQRTGGLESAIAIHTANNVFLLIVASLSDQMDAGFDRSAGTGGPFMLVPLALLAAIVAGLSWFAKRRRLARTTGGADTAAEASPATGPIPISTGETSAGAESLTQDVAGTGPGHTSATTGPIPTDIGRSSPHTEHRPGE